MAAIAAPVLIDLTDRVDTLPPAPKFRAAPKCRASLEEEVSPNVSDSFQEQEDNQLFRRVFPAPASTASAPKLPALFC